jgi:hypothetical protein
MSKDNGRTARRSFARVAMPREEGARLFFEATRTGQAYEVAATLTLPGCPLCGRVGKRWRSTAGGARPLQCRASALRGSPYRLWEEGGLCRLGEIEKNERICGLEVVLTRLVHDAQKTSRGGQLIRKNFVHLPDLQILVLLGLNAESAPTTILTPCLLREPLDLHSSPPDSVGFVPVQLSTPRERIVADPRGGGKGNVIAGQGASPRKPG